MQFPHLSFYSFFFHFQANQRQLAPLCQESTPVEKLMESIRNANAKTALRKTTGPPIRPSNSSHSILKEQYLKILTLPLYSEISGIGHFEHSCLWVLIGSYTVFTGWCRNTRHGTLPVNLWFSWSSSFPIEWISQAHFLQNSIPLHWSILWWYEPLIHPQMTLNRG